MSSGLKCNGCWTQHKCTDPHLSSGKAVVTSCSHLFCSSCAERMLQQEQCLLCDSIITQGNVKAVNVAQSASSLQLALCGQAPDVVLSTALSAINFYIGQQQLQAEAQIQITSSRLDKMQDACRKKLQEVHGAYVQSKRKLQEQALQTKQLEQDNTELQNKYNQKAMQSKRLNEMFRKVQLENEALKRGSGKSGVISVASGHGVAPMPMPSPHLGHQQGQQQMPMVTTLHQRTQVFANAGNGLPNNLAAIMQGGGMKRNSFQGQGQGQATHNQMVALSLGGANPLGLDYGQQADMMRGMISQQGNKRVHMQQPLGNLTNMLQPGMGGGQGQMRQMFNKQHMLGSMSPSDMMSM